MGRKKTWLSKYKFQKGHPCLAPAYKFQKDHPCLAPAYSPGSPALSHDEDTSRTWMPRMTQEDHSLVVKLDPKGRPSLPDADGVCTGAKVLRPKSRLEDTTKQYLHGDGSGEMRFLHRDKTTEMWNLCILDHAERVGYKCGVPQFEIHKEKQKGLCWIQSLRCTLCDYISLPHKLYEEVPSRARGPKYAKPNLGLQVGLQECAIGNTKARILLLSTNSPAPSTSAMQKASNKVGTITSGAAEEDLARRRLKLKEINKMRNLPQDSPVNVSVDVRYNTCSITSRGKMGQSATQAIGVAIENHTDAKQIVGLCLENKLCHHGAWLRSNGCQVKCPGGHPACSATKNMAEPFSEQDIGGKLGQDLANQGILIKHVTTDGDGRSAQGISAAMKELDPLWQVTRQADTTHLGQSQFHKGIKATFSDSMLPGTTKEEKKEQQKMLALDIKHRCHKIYKNMFQEMTGDIHKITKRMPTVIECTLDCYAGDCCRCRKQSIICTGGKNNWMSQSMYLQACGVTSLIISHEDRQVLRELLKFYLGNGALKLIKLNNNTNKNEAVNRAISSSLPKNVLFARNAKARALSAISRLNKGAGNALVESLKSVGSPVSKGGRVAKAMRHLETNAKYHQAYSKSGPSKLARYRARYNQMKEYFACKRQKKVGDYAKRQLDPGHPRSKQTSTNMRKTSQRLQIEHSYCEKSFCQRSDHQYSLL